MKDYNPKNNKKQEQKSDASPIKRYDRRYLGLILQHNALHPKEEVSPKDFYKQFKPRTKQYPYVLFIWDDDNIVDARIVKTKERLDLIVKDSIKNGKKVMVHPQPVKIPKNFWKQWKQAKDGNDRLFLIKRDKIVSDDNVYVFVSLVLDIDSPYYLVEPVFLELVKRLGIKGYGCGKSKSGNFRAFIYLEPTVIKTNDSGRRSFYLTPHGKHTNGHTHLQNYKEMLSIINLYFQKKNLKADPSFVRANHPIWCGDERFYKPVKEVVGASKFYDVYNAIKKLQKELGLWETNRIYWPEYYKEQKKRRTKKKNANDIYMLPDTAKFIANQYDDLAKWKIATKRLSEQHTSYRFTKVMMPSIGWAKDLGLPEDEVYDYLREILYDKKNFDRDFKIAYRYADCKFEWNGSYYSNRVDPKDLLVDFLKFVSNEPRRRQELVTHVCNGIEAIYYSVESYAIGQGFITKEKAQVQGRGRKPYLISITEKGKAFLDALDKPQQKPKQSADETSNTTRIRISPEKLIFSIYKKPPKGAVHSLEISSDLRKQDVLGKVELTKEEQKYGLEEVGNRQPFFKGCLKINRYIPTDSKFFKDKYSSFCLKIICLFKDIGGYGNPGKSFSGGNLYEKLMLYAFENRQEALKWLEANVKDVDEVKLRIKTSIKFNDVCTFRRTEEDGWRFVSIDLSMRKENQDPSLISELPSTSCETKRKHPLQIITDKLHPIKFWKDKKEYRRLDKPA